MPLSTGAVRRVISYIVSTYKRKNSIPDTDAIYKELKEDCASNINVVDIESQIKLMIDNGLPENRPNNQGLDSFFILNSNIQI